MPSERNTIVPSLDSVVEVSKESILHFIISLISEGFKLSMVLLFSFLIVFEACLVFF